jgi:hypothetical protein
MSASESGASWMGPFPASAGCDCHVCRPDESYDEMDRRVIDTVVEHGWQVLGVTNDVGCSHPDHDHETDDHDASWPPFSYTVGLGHRAGHPELLMSGLDHRVMHRVLDDVARRIMQGLRLRPGDALEGALPGVPLAVERLADSALDETVSWSGWFHRRPPEALVLVWPDWSGVFGWQPGASADLDERQPPVWRVPIEHTGGLATAPAWEFPAPPDHLTFSCSHVIDEGAAVLWAARESDADRGEAWSIHCALGHEDDEIRLVHLAHLVRAAPSLREISGLGLDMEALRATADAAWVTARVP